MTRLELFKTALAQTINLRSRHPDDSAVVSIVKQLEYLIELEDGARSDAGRLNEIIIGVLTVREIEPLDNSVAESLYNVVEEVEQMKRERKSHRATYHSTNRAVAMNSDWYELWVDDGVTIPYVLIVLPQEAHDGKVRILDPKDGNRIVHEAADYEAAKLWLLEDEYRKVGDRIMR